jgi:serine/threonine protein kinase
VIVEILFEDGGETLEKFCNVVEYEMIYKLMRQSANALALIHRSDLVYFDVKPFNMEVWCMIMAKACLSSLK